MQFGFDDSVFTSSRLGAHKELLGSCISALSADVGAVQDGGSCSYRGVTGVFLPLKYMRKDAYRDAILRAVSECCSVGCDAILVVGIGGSSLGASAVYEALAGNRNIECVPLYFLETIDPDEHLYLEDLIGSGGSVHIIIISKSGTTFETAINSAFVIDILQATRPHDWKSYVTIISDLGSSLAEQAKKMAVRFLEIPGDVGGRFSIFSPVGLFPLALAGIDIDELCRGAVDELADFKTTGIDSRAAMSAKQLYSAYEQGFFVHDTFIWDAALEQLGKWYRQLCAESLGKRENVHGAVVETGILPTVSVGTQDLHSMVQFYLGGPRHLITTFVTVTAQESVTIPKNEFCDSHYAGRDLDSVRRAIFTGVCAAYRDDKRPFMVINLEKTPYDIGRFMIMKMLEIILVGAQLEVNVFDQPEVEKYKRIARAAFMSE